MDLKHISLIFYKNLLEMIINWNFENQKQNFKRVLKSCRNLGINDLFEQCKKITKDPEPFFDLFIQKNKDQIQEIFKYKLL